MYKKILICLDNSDHSIAAADLALAVASSCGARAAGCHVYAARLHNDRFTQMEGGLPEEYRDETALKGQREVHDTLISKGLKIISDSYTAVFLARAKALSVEAVGVSREGKNFEEILKEADEGGYDLIVMGSHGLGRSPGESLGGNAARVARLARADVLIVKDSTFNGAEGPIVAAIDGSPGSFGGLLRAVALSRAFKSTVEAISAFDPGYHQTAFRSIAGVLSEEAGNIFRFKEQERLHEEIIDRGLARLYQGHLDAAASIADSRGTDIKASLLSGKPAARILDHIIKTRPFLLVLGRTGAHRSPSLDIGSTAENCLRSCPCNVLISALEHSPQAASGLNPLRWSLDALKLLERIPSFARGIVKGMAEDAARRSGAEEVTVELMRRARRDMTE